MRYTRRGIVAAVLVGPLAVALACDKGGEGAGRSVATDEVMQAQSGMAARVQPEAAPPPPGMTSVEGKLEGIAVAAPPAIPTVVSPDSPSGATSDPTTQSPTNAASANAMIIRTGTATIKVDSLEPAVARLRQLALSVGGYIGTTSMQTGKDQLRSATVEIKVPAARWSQLLSGLKPIGTLEAQDEQAEDVGEEFVDVQARVANSRRLEERLITLLANRTGKLSDVLAVERELARVREEIERYEGRMRYLRTRSSVSTMTVTVHEPAPVLGNQPGENPIGDAFRNAWRNFVGLVAFAISSLGVIVPVVLVLAGVVWWRRKPRG